MTSRRATHRYKEQNRAIDERQQLIDELREQLGDHLDTLGLDARLAASQDTPEAKQLVRSSHSAQRKTLIDKERRWVRSEMPRLLWRFAEGAEIEPTKISVELRPVSSGDDALLFRLATMLWSVPVSRGYGRRMRFIVTDGQNEKIIGLFALGDPVFNLRVRDEFIGWTVEQRRQHLVSVMDAYVVGAVPPYDRILGGKLVTSLLGSREVCELFDEKYRGTRGGISKRIKSARLALVTVTSALGRSSIYNRVRLPGVVALEAVGSTQGWGHFHVPEGVFLKMRSLLLLDGHSYANGHGYGDGPNWKLRAIRAALEAAGLSGDALKHGISREVFAMSLGSNWRDYLRGDAPDLIQDRPFAATIGAAALERWVVPRSLRTADYANWTREDLHSRFDSILSI